MQNNATQAAGKVVINTFYLYMRMAITVFSSLYTTRLILNALGANDFGLFGLIAGLIAMLTFLNSAMMSASQRFMSFAKGKNDVHEEKSVFNISVVLHVSIGIFLALALASLTPLLFSGILNINPARIDTAQMIYHFMILSTFFTILSVPYDAVINAHENMLLVAVLGVFESLLKLAIAFYVTVYEGDKLIIYGFLTALITIILLIIKGIYSHRSYEEATINFKKYFDKHLFKKMTGFASYTLLGISAQMIANYGSGIILNIFFGTVVNAAQGIVVQITGQLGAFARTMLTALNPMIAKSEGTGNRKLMLNASFAGSKISFFLLIFFYIPVLFEMPFIFKSWLVNVPEYTIIFSTIQMVRNLIEQLYVTLYASISSVGNIRNFQIVNAVLSLLPLPLSYVLFDYGYPPQTIYLIFALYAVAQGGIYLYYARHECGMSLLAYWNEVIVKACVPLIMILMAVAIPHFIVTNDLYRFISVSAVHLIVFSLTIWFIGLSRTEKDFVMQFVNRVLRRNQV